MRDMLVGNTLKYSKCFHQASNNILRQGYKYVNGVKLPDRHFYNDAYVGNSDKTVYD